MIEALLGRVEGFIEKGFLFSSMLPALIFLSSLSGTLVIVIGFDAAWVWLTGRTASELSIITVLAVIGSIAFAYILSGLRTFFVRLWSGMFEFPLVSLFLRLVNTSSASAILR